MQRFVVGSGRCGSTLLSRMLACHRDVASLFEYFNGIDMARRFAPEPVSGAALAELVSAEQPFVTAVLRRGYPVSEIVYPFDGAGRHRREDPLPWILVSMLPRLSDDPDALFDAAMAFLRGRPARPAPAHHLAFFDWLAERSGRRCWIERSGSSIDYLGGLHAAFPGARFVHIHRDGPETALSMREHHAYRLPISILYQAPLDGGETLADLGPLDLHAAPTGSDPISRILASRPPAATFGRYWNDQIAHGFQALAGIEPSRVHTVRFEDVVERPAETLEAIAAFFDLPPDPDFAARGAALVRGMPPSRLGDLPPAEREALVEACRPGQERLGRA
ncbi:MAG: sulfotransferase [Myxococcota bacterium]